MLTTVCELMCVERSDGGGLCGLLCDFDLLCEQWHKDSEHFQPQCTSDAVFVVLLRCFRLC